MLDQVVLFLFLFRSKYCFIYEKAIRINVRTADVHRGALLVFCCCDFDQSSNRDYVHFTS